jgi:hypothetical protein
VPTHGGLRQHRQLSVRRERARGPGLAAAPGVRPAGTETLPGAAEDSAPQTADLDAAIAEAVEHAAGLVQVAHEAAEMAVRILGQLAELLEERSPASDADTAQRADAASQRVSVDALPADVLEIAILDAHADGVGVADYLRDAVLAYSSQGSRESAGRDLEARRRAAHREAARLQAQNRAGAERTGDPAAVPGEPRAAARQRRAGRQRGRGRSGPRGALGSALSQSMQGDSERTGGSCPHARAAPAAASRPMQQSPDEPHLRMPLHARARSSCRVHRRT